jgi:hypothetical protein
MYYASRSNLPDRVNLFRVVNGNESAVVLILKYVAYPWFLMGKLTEIFYVDNFIEHFDWHST